MGLEKLIQFAAVLGLLAVSTGQLPKILHVVRMAQVDLIRASHASNWERAVLLPH